MPPPRRLPTPPGPAGQVVRARARERALGYVRDKYRAEYDERYQLELERAVAEAAEHLATARFEHPGEAPPEKASPSQTGPKFGVSAPMPPPLVNGGRTASGPRLRDDVARCPYCVTYHDRGHMCRACGHRPPPPRDTSAVQVLKR